MVLTEGSRWFRRFVKDCKDISSHIRIVKIKYGFYRIYWKEAYLHEVYKEMPMKGYDIEDDDVRMQESQKYYEEFEDGGEVTRKIKNYVEGYWDSLDTIRTRVYMMKNNDEFRQRAFDAYKQMVVR